MNTAHTAHWLQASKIVIGNWKMNVCAGTVPEFVEQLLSQVAQNSDKYHEFVTQKAIMAVCPPAVWLAPMVTLAKGTPLQLGGQDVSSHESGAFTGEVSSKMLEQTGATCCIVGHSERRQYHGEGNIAVLNKSLQCLSNGLVPVVCVGETLEQREQNKWQEVVAYQLEVFADAQLNSQLVKDGKAALVAYEPVWAIGTGKAASAEQAQEVHAFIFQQLAQMGLKLPILYGGSVNAQNVNSFFAQPDISGALVGGASLKPNDFAAICTA